MRGGFVNVGFIMRGEISILAIRITELFFTRFRYVNILKNKELIRIYLCFSLLKLVSKGWF